MTIHYRVEKTNSGLNLNIKNVEQDKDMLLTAIQECKEGRCSCPSKEYDKLEGIDVLKNGSDMQISLTAKNNEELDVNDIERCLDYTIKSIKPSSL